MSDGSKDNKRRETNEDETKSKLSAFDDANNGQGERDIGDCGHEIGRRADPKIAHVAASS